MGVSEQQGDDAAGDLAQAHPESVARIVYASQASIDGSVYAEMERIRASALRNNAPLGVYTALLYQSGWFVQWKEGPGAALQRLMARVQADSRHHSMRIVHASRGPRLLTGPWSMAIVQTGESPQEMAHRVQQVRHQMDAGRQYSPPAVWRQLSTPLSHPGAARQGEPDAFQRVLVCSSVGEGSYALVNWLAERNAQPVVHRRFAGAHDHDVGTDLVDFEEDGRTLRVIAMARNGLLLPLTRAFLPDYSHLVMLLSGDAGRDLSLLQKIGQACVGLLHPPTLLGVAADDGVHGELFHAARRMGLVYLQCTTASQDPASAWACVQPVLALWREAANSGTAPSIPRHPTAELIWLASGWGTRH